MHVDTVTLWGLKNAEAIDAIENPQWRERGRVHDWRNYVPILLQENWDQLSSDVRLAVYAMAEDRASQEEWD